MGLGIGAEGCGDPMCTEVLQQTVSVLIGQQLSDDQLELRLQGCQEITHSKCLAGVVCHSCYRWTESTTSGNADPFSCSAPLVPSAEKLNIVLTIKEKILKELCPL